MTLEDRLDAESDAFAIITSDATSLLARQMFEPCYSELAHHLGLAMSEEWRSDTFLLEETCLTIEDFFSDFVAWLSREGASVLVLARHCVLNLVRLYLDALLIQTKRCGPEPDAV